MAAALLLAHSPLVGCAAWDLVAADLAGSGCELRVPDLTGTVLAGPPYFSRQARAIADAASGRPAILVGHSGAGPLLAAAGAITGQARGYVFVDAGLPAPGKSWMETVPPDLAAQITEMADARGWLPPWSQWWGDEALAELLPDPAVRQRFADGCPRLPLAMFTETHPAVPQRPDAPAAYLLLSETYQEEAVTARELGWPVKEQMSHHLALLTEPGRVAASIRELIGQLGA